MKASALLLLAFLSPEIALAQSSEAQVNYMLQCQGCHLADGSGMGNSVPDFRQYLGGYLRVPYGREYMVRVPGSANAPLTAAQLAEVLNWIVTTLAIGDLPADFKPFTAAEVVAYKADPLIDVAAARARLIRQTSKQD